MRRFMRKLWNYRDVLVFVFTPLALLPLPLAVGTKVSRILIPGSAGCPSNLVRLRAAEDRLWNDLPMKVHVLYSFIANAVSPYYGSQVSECAFVLCLMAVYWVTEVLPLSITAMLPALLFPLLGIMKSSEVARVYFKDFHFLLIGVICLATSIEKWGLHRRIALKLITLVGVNPAWLLLGFMGGCSFLSMWVHNTSAVTMVMPIVEAVIQHLVRPEEVEVTHAGTHDNPGLELNETAGHVYMEENMMSTGQHPEEAQGHCTPEEPSSHVEITVPVATESPYGRSRNRERMLCKALCLGVAYSSNIGGIATLPGTSPNLIFSQYINEFYPGCNSINFGNWLLLCLPISIIMLMLSWIWLHWLFIGSDSQELVTLGVFILMAALWLTRDPGFMPGWASLFPTYTGYTTDATVALLLGLLMFIIPAHGPSTTPDAMISWKEFQRTMPWEVMLLVGGGFALAEGTQVSGLSFWVSSLLSPLGHLPALATVTVACVIVTTVTEVTSNAATITIFLPILAPLAETIHVNPLYMLIPTTLCTSFSFLLPVSNPANAVVFAYGHLNTVDMVKAGLGVNVIGLLAVLLAMTTWGTPLFALNTYPDWAPALPHSNSTGQ